jgi:predicted nucleic acid-binding protein
LLAYTEFWSALLGKERAGAIDSKQRCKAWSAFELDVDGEGIRLEPLSPAIFKKANRILADCHPMVALRSLDALHLATCDHLQDWPLCTTDMRMRQAAALLRFSLGDIPG